MWRALSAVIAILLNVALSYAVKRLGLPLYLDTIGTITAAALGGLFPGIMTAVLTNLICTVFNREALYFTVVHVLIAVYASRVAKKDNFRKIGATLTFWLIAGTGSGLLSGLIQWALFGGAQNTAVADMVTLLHENTDAAVFPLFLSVNVALDLLDKGIAVVLTFIMFLLVPRKVRQEIRDSGWKQKPLTPEEQESIRKWGAHVKRPIRNRIIWVLTAVSMSLVLIMGGIGITLYFNAAKDDRRNNAIQATEFAAEMIDTQKLDAFLEQGKEAEGYGEMEEMLDRIRKNAPYVDHLYVFKARESSLRYIFYLDIAGESSYGPGDEIYYEDGAMEELTEALNGTEAIPVEYVTPEGWFMTVYEPVKGVTGTTACYVGADVSLDYMAGYMQQFLLKVFLILTGFLVLIIACGTWVTDYYMVYPINSIAACVEDFVQAGEDQTALDENVRHLRTLDVRTDDETEKLYDSLCEMSAGMAEQMRDLRHYMTSTAKMQNGLIITMADMVENRDSDTGAHIQKTAAYVRIILEGLKRKGYYAEKLTPKYMADVEMSAPLHDVGKINISDTILNKPGKLTDEEYEIMKTHTTQGKQIMEKAISTVRGENYLKEARNMAGYHHERWDGKGYPEGLHGEVIPLSARVMAVADVFDALTSARVYKPPYPFDEALKMIQDGSGTQFDPKCVDAFMDSLVEVKLVYTKYQDQ